MKITWPANDALRPLDLLAGRLDSTIAPRIVQLLNETDAAAAWRVVLDDSREVGWLAARTAPLAGRSAGVVRAGLRATHPIGPIEESMLSTTSGDALRLVQRLALEVPEGRAFVVVQASWSWVAGNELVVLSTSSAEPALAELLIAQVDALAAKIVIDV